VHLPRRLQALFVSGRTAAPARPNDRGAWPPAPAVQCMVYCAVRYDLARFVTFNRFECSVAYRQHRGLTNKIDFFT
jgi:hypothetical protein